MGFVALTDKAEQSLVEKLAKAVAEAAQLNMLEVHKQYARAEAELVQVRMALTHKDQMIAELQARNSQLINIINTNSQPPAPAFNPYNNGAGQYPIQTTHAMPLMPERYAVQSPLPDIIPVSPAPATS